LPSEKVRGLYSSPDIKSDAYWVLVGKPEVKAPLANPRCRWKGIDGIQLV